MKISFLSNYFNHHQKPFCDSMYKMCNTSFYFFETSEMSEERKNLGYSNIELPDYVKKIEKNNILDLEIQKILEDSDVLIVGSASEEYVKPYFNKHKLIIRYSERLYKESFQLYKWPVRVIRMWNKYSKKNQFLLCASAYTAGDFAITGNFINKSYKWGYFPETITYDIDLLCQNKIKHRILWCGRLLDWKHPDSMLSVAKKLKIDGYYFEMCIIGSGKMYEELKNQIKKENLCECVHIFNAMSPEQIRKQMEISGIYVFSSDFREGWGAVLNEAMNSACAVVASHAIGAVPFLVKNKVNGLIYKNGNNEDLYRNIKFLLDNNEQQRILGESAYATIKNLWNAEVASERFVKFVEEINDHGYCDLFEDGPCSRANIISNNWFRG